MKNPIWQNQDQQEARNSRPIGEYNMIMITVEDVYFSDSILVLTVHIFVTIYLKLYQWGILFIAAVVVAITLIVAICIIRNNVVGPILELTDVIQTGDSDRITEFERKIDLKL